MTERDEAEYARDSRVMSGSPKVRALKIQSRSVTMEDGHSLRLVTYNLWRWVSTYLIPITLTTFREGIEGMIVRERRPDGVENVSLRRNRREMGYGLGYH